MHYEAAAWNPDVYAATALAASALLYVVGLTRMRRRGAAPAHFEMAAFAGGWLILVFALLSPIATMAEWLFSVHMTQHELLMLVAAPLLAIGRPMVPMLFALPRRVRLSGGRAAAVLRLTSSPFAVFLLHALALWIWHVPLLYEAAVRDERIHLIQHVCFTATAMLFWWGLTRGRYGRLGYGAAFIYVFATAVHTEGLGALLTFSARPWYPLYAAQQGPLAALADQQLAGLIMWVPAGVLMMLFGLALFAAWLGEAERRRRRGWS